MVIYENIKVIESTIKVYGNMPVIERPYCTVVILINATTLMHKSTLNTNNFGNNDFGQKYQKQNNLGIFRRLYWCFFEKFPTNRAKTRKCVFG